MCSSDLFPSHDKPVLFDFLDLGRCSRLFRYHLPYSLDLVLVALIVGKLVFMRLLFYNRRRFLLGSFVQILEVRLMKKHNCHLHIVFRQH